ncbi:MAG: hypothetical protein ABUT39_14675 [Acidobacteriota bacterium]
MRAFRRPLLAAALLLLSIPAARADERDKQKTYDTRYEIRYLDIHAAESLAWEQCPDKSACVVMGALNVDRRGGALTVRADSETHAKLARVLAEKDAAPPTQTFHVVLLAAGNKDSNPAPELAAGARKALDDMKGFLPFKSYRVVDTSLIRVIRDETVQARVLGPSGSNATLILRFSSGGADGKKLYLNTFTLNDEKSGRLLQTAFSMDVGESIVVGTSSVSGSDEALVTIVTAVP